MSEAITVDHDRFGHPVSRYARLILPPARAVGYVTPHFARNASAAGRCRCSHSQDG